MTSISDASGGGRGFPTAPTILSEQEQQAVWFLGALVRVRTHGSTTGGALAVLEHSGERGYSSPLHRHRDDEETFIVLDGELRVEVDGVTQSAGAGAAAMLPRGLAHSFVVTSKEARFLTIHTPAGFEAFAVRAGEPAASFDAPPRMCPRQTRGSSLRWPPSTASKSWVHRRRHEPGMRGGWSAQSVATHTITYLGASRTRLLINVIRRQHTAIQSRRAHDRRLVRARPPHRHAPRTPTATRLARP